MAIVLKTRLNAPWAVGLDLPKMGLLESAYDRVRRRPMIAQAAQALDFGATSEDIAYTFHAYPTHAEAFNEAAMGVLGKPIHI